MKITIIYSIVFFLSACLLQSCKGSADFSVGKTVACKWTDNNYYLAKIANINDDKYFVDYADGTQGEVNETDLRILTPKEDLKTGDKVLAVWAGVKFYSGKIIEMKEKNALVIWDDGSAQSEVEYDKILKLE
jgi:hypothetical protein